MMTPYAEEGVGFFFCSVNRRRLLMSIIAKISIPSQFLL